MGIVIDTQIGQVDITQISKGFGFDIDSIAQILSRICRYNGQCQTFYSVAEHSLAVQHRLAVMRAAKRTQLAGLLHDVAESYIGDVIRPIKDKLFVVDSDALRPFRSFEEDLRKKILESLDLPATLFDREAIARTIDDADDYVLSIEMSEFFGKGNGKYRSQLCEVDDHDELVDKFLRTYRRLRKESGL